MSESQPALGENFEATSMRLVLLGPVQIDLSTPGSRTDVAGALGERFELGIGEVATGKSIKRGRGIPNSSLKNGLTPPSGGV